MCKTEVLSFQEKIGLFHIPLHNILQPCIYSPPNPMLRLDFWNQSSSNDDPSNCSYLLSSVLKEQLKFPWNANTKILYIPDKNALITMRLWLLPCLLSLSFHLDLMCNYYWLTQGYIFLSCRVANWKLGLHQRGLGRPFPNPSSWYPRLFPHSCHSSFMSLLARQQGPTSNKPSLEGLFLWGQQEQKSRQTTWRLWVPLKPRLLVGWVFSYPTNDNKYS